MCFSGICLALVHGLEDFFLARFLKQMLVYLMCFLFFKRNLQCLFLVVVTLCSRFLNVVSSYISCFLVWGRIFLWSLTALRL